MAVRIASASLSCHIGAAKARSATAVERKDVSYCPTSPASSPSHCRRACHADDAALMRPASKSQQSWIGSRRGSRAYSWGWRSVDDSRSIREGIPAHACYGLPSPAPTASAAACPTLDLFRGCCGCHRNRGRARCVGSSQPGALWRAANPCCCSQSIRLPRSYVEDGDHLFLKTISPSHKATRDYLRQDTP